VNRRWLLAYPRAYRSERGEEIMATVLESGRSGPRVAVNLVLHGLRARLGRPASRTVVFWSIATALIGGLFAASMASWVAWTNGKPHPDEAEIRTVLTEVLPEYPFSDITVATDIFTFYSQPLSWENLPSVLAPANGGEYQLGSSGGSVFGAVPNQNPDVAPQLLERLRQAGWHVYAPDVTEQITCHTKLCETPVPTTYTSGVARRGDVVMNYFVNSAAGPEETHLSVSLQRMAPASVWPAGVAGGLVGAVLTWLVFGWASRRSDGRPGVNACFAVTIGCWWGLGILGIPTSIAHLSSEPHPQWHPLWEWLALPPFAPVFVLGVATALLGLLLAAVPTRRTEDAMAQ
jgi:hypothetical protein